MLGSILSDFRNLREVFLQCCIDGGGNLPEIATSVSCEPDRMQLYLKASDEEDSNAATVNLMNCSSKPGFVSPTQAQGRKWFLE